MKVLILGGTSPIARLLAIKFASIGARLYIAARDEAEEDEEDGTATTHGRSVTRRCRDARSLEFSSLAGTIYCEVPVASTFCAW